MRGTPPKQPGRRAAVRKVLTHKLAQQQLAEELREVVQEASRNKRGALQTLGNLRDHWLHIATTNPYVGKDLAAALMQQLARCGSPKLRR